jgi:uncharacterized protein
MLSKFVLLLCFTIRSLGAASLDVPLLKAVREGNREAVKTLVKVRSGINESQPDGATALHWAVHLDDLETAKLLIGAGAKVDAANNYGITAISLACTNGNLAMVELLLNAGADPNSTQQSGETALMTCARAGSLEAVKMLLARGASVKANENRRGQTALMWAVSEKHPEVVRVLVEHEADVRAREKSGFTPLLFAARVGDLDSGRLLLASGADANEASPDGLSVLLMAAASGHEDFAIYLLKQGADPNRTDDHGISALHYAVQKGIAALSGVVSRPLNKYLFRPNMKKLVEVLLERGADPNVRISKEVPDYPISISARRNLVGATPYFLAAAAADASIMRLLVANGADPLIATNENMTPLMAATGTGRVQDRSEEEQRAANEAAVLAVELGDDVNAVNVDGMTALHGAAFTGADDIVRFLVDKGANLDAQDKYGQTSWSIAEGLIPENAEAVAATYNTKHETTANLLRQLGTQSTH